MGVLDQPHPLGQGHGVDVLEGQAGKVNTPAAAAAAVVFCRLVVKIHPVRVFEVN